MRPLIDALHQGIFDLTKFKLSPQDWSVPPQRQLGDIAIPCFRLAKQLGKSPAALAQELAPQLAQNCQNTVKSVKAVGPYLNAEFHSAKTLQWLRGETQKDLSHFGGSGCGKGKSIVIDFSSPNIAKEMALHHLRSTGIGNALANIASLHGYQVVRLNYLGDWGTSHGKNLLGLKLFGSEEELLKEGLLYILQIYIRFNQEEEKNPDLSVQAKAAFAQLETGNPEYHRIWKVLRDISVKDYKKLYDRLQIAFDTYDGESLYVGKVLDEVVQEITEKVGTRLSEGALVCDMPGHKIPILLKKDDGASLYVTRDLAALADRWKRFSFDEAWYVVDVRQSLHFKQLFDVVGALKKPYAGRMTHIPFGMLKFGTQVMKTRTGNIIYLNDVLDEAKKKALDIIKEKNPSLENADGAAEMIGMGAILFNDLSQHRERDISFQWEQALSFDGDTAPFIQYTHARCASLKKKCQPLLESLPLQSTDASTDSILEHVAVRFLLGEISYFVTFSERALSEKDPSQISNSLLNISKAFNQLYHKIRFMDETHRERLEVLLQLTQLTKDTLKHGLKVLGINAPDSM